MERKIVMYRNIPTEEAIESFLLSRVPKYYIKTPEDRAFIINKLQRGCHNCKLCYETKFSPIPSILNPNSFAVFIGRSPCKTEALVNELYPQGTSLGSLFEQYLSRLGLGKSEVSVINMVNCYTSGNRPPEQQCINKCIAYKRFEFEVIGNSYRVVFLMGNDACRWVFGLNSPGVLSSLGEIYEVKEPRPIIFIPIIHPAHLLIQPEYKQDVEKVLKKSREIINKIKKG